MKFYSAVFMIWATSGFAFADENRDLEIFEDEVETPAWIVEALQNQEKVDELDAPPSSTDNAVRLGAIVNLGRKIWQVVEDNQPILNVERIYANALPKGITNSSELEEFSSLQSEIHSSIRSSKRFSKKSSLHSSR